MQQSEKWRKAKRQAQQIRHRKNKKASCRHLLRMIMEALSCHDNTHAEAG